MSKRKSRSKRPVTLGFVATIAVSTDDDFDVCIAGHVISYSGVVRLHALTPQQALDAALSALDKATLPWAKTWSITTGDGVVQSSGSYASHWEDLKQRLLERIAEWRAKPAANDSHASWPPAVSWEVGGNQTLKLTIEAA